MRYVATPTPTGWAVLDVKTLKVVESRRGMSCTVATRAAAQWERSQDDRAKWHRRECQLGHRAPKGADALPRFEFSHGRAVWTEPGTYNRMPLK